MLLVVASASYFAGLSRIILPAVVALLASIPVVVHATNDGYVRLAD
jgi:hypothetical protein